MPEEFQIKESAWRSPEMFLGWLNNLTSENSKASLSAVGLNDTGDVWR